MWKAKCIHPFHTHKTEGIIWHFASDYFSMNMWTRWPGGQLPLVFSLSHSWVASGIVLTGGEERLKEDRHTGTYTVIWWSMSPLMEDSRCSSNSETQACTFYTSASGRQIYRIQLNKKAGLANLSRGSWAANVMEEEAVVDSFYIQTRSRRRLHHTCGYEALQSVTRQCSSQKHTLTPPPPPASLAPHIL